MIRFRCGQCGQKIGVPEAHAGKRGKCPKCGAVVTIPAPAPAAVAAPQEPPIDPLTELARQVQPQPSYDLAAEYLDDPRAGFVPEPSVTVYSPAHYKPARRSSPSGTPVGGIVKTILVLGLLGGVVAGGVYVFRSNNLPVRASAPKPDLNRDLEQYAREAVPGWVRGRENAESFLKNLHPDRRDGAPTPAKHTYTSKFVSAEAEPLEGDAKYDALGTISYELDRGDGKTEVVTQKLGRKRADGKWDLYRQVDAAVVQFKERVQPLIAELRAMKALRAVGANVLRHEEQLVKLIAAYQAVGNPPDQPSCRALSRHTSTAIEEYRQGTAYWRKGIGAIGGDFEETLTRAHESSAQVHLAKADRAVESALADYRAVEAEAEDW